MSCKATIPPGEILDRGEEGVETPESLVRAFAAVSLSSSAGTESDPNDTAARKKVLRFRVWDLMESRNFVKDYPRPCHEKIPHFKGCAGAATKLSRLREFRRARCIKVNPSLAQMHLRFLTLKYGKILIGANPSLEAGFLYQVDPKKLSHFWQLKRGSSKAGAAELGDPVDVNSKLNIRLVVIGSVACAANGVRLGKGQGFAELEWAILATMGAVTSDTIVATTVHDAQVLNDADMPLSLLAEHDLPVDIIVTPTRIINVRPRLPKPMRGVLWHQLSAERIAAMPILQQMQQLELNKTGLI